MRLPAALFWHRRDAADSRMSITMAETSTLDAPQEAQSLPKPQEPAYAPWTPKYNPWIVALTVTLATFMEVLDSSIANVALPHIAGGLSAGQDESTWVLTR